jgi:Flp pilus assembly protein TadD
MNVRAALLACLTVFATAGLFAQHTPSLADLEALARTDSNDPAAHFALAQAWLQAKQQDSARRALETAVLIDREFAPAYLLLGRIEGALLPAPLMAIQQTSEAADTLRRVVTLHPRESRASYMLGIAAARLGAYQEARDGYTRFLQLAPSRYTDMIADARERLSHLPPP